MADSSSEANFEQAVEAQRKFETYAVALTFTILGLSVQTGKFGTSLVADALEILGWIALFASGLLGLRRFEQTPHIFELYGHLGNFQARIRGFEEGIAKGARVVHVGTTGPRAIETELDSAKESAEKLRTRIKPKADSIWRMYSWQRGSFLAGLASVLCARAYEPAARIIVVIIKAFH